VFAARRGTDGEPVGIYVAAADGTGLERIG
jgi:hypothetical protein